ncbi:MAG: hypothetical protein ABIN95_07910 [Mucilaginibacter sp.]
MKKLILFFIIIAGANYAGAQNIQPLLMPKPALPYAALKSWQPVATVGSLKVRPGKKSVVTASPVKKDDAVIFYSNMPVAKSAKGNSRMPVLDLNNDNTRYTMPVAKVDIVNPDTVGVEQVIP